MTINPISMSSCSFDNSFQAHDAFRDLKAPPIRGNSNGGAAAALSMQDTCNERSSVDALKEGSFRLSETNRTLFCGRLKEEESPAKDGAVLHQGSCQPAKSIASRGKGMYLNSQTFSSFRMGSSMLWEPSRRPSSPCEDYWSDSSLSLACFASPNLQELECSKKPGVTVTGRSFSPDRTDEELHKPENDSNEGRQDASPEEKQIGFPVSREEEEEEEEEDEEERTTSTLRYDTFPPPIASPTRCTTNSHLPGDMQRVFLRSIKQDGRFILKELPVPPPQRYLRVQRGNGRLCLQLIEGDQRANTEVEQEEERCTELQHDSGEVVPEALAKACRNDDGDNDDVDASSSSSSSSADISKPAEKLGSCELGSSEFDDDWNENDNGDGLQAKSLAVLHARQQQKNINRMALWPPSQSFLHKSITRMRPLVY